MQTISIIIPIYNRAEFLTASVRSVLQQSYSNVEVICVDDASTDGTAKTLQQLQTQDSRIKVVRHSKNLGTHMARKTGVEHASGDYLMFLDCDDTLAPHACEHLIEKLKIADVQVIEFAYQGSKEKKLSLPLKNITIENFFTSLIYPKHHRAGTIWNKIYNADLVKKAFEKMTDFYSIVGEDYFESIVIAYHVKSYEQTDDVLYHYMYNETQSVSFGEKNFKQIKKYMESMSVDIKALEIFFKSYAPEHTKALLNIEQGFIDDMYYSQILSRVNRREWKQCFSLLPQYFSEEALAPYKKRIAAPVFFIVLDYRIRQSFVFIKSLFPRSFKDKIKKLLRKDYY